MRRYGSKMRLRLEPIPKVHISQQQSISGREAPWVPRRGFLYKAGPIIEDRGPESPTCQAELKLWLS